MTFRLILFMIRNFAPVYTIALLLWAIAALICLVCILWPFARWAPLATRARAAGMAALVVLGFPAMLALSLKLISVLYQGEPGQGLSAAAQAAAPAGHPLIFASVLGANHISVIDLTTFTEIKRIPAQADGPGSGSLTPDESKLYIMNAGPRSNTVDVINTRTLKIDRQFPISGTLGDRGARIQEDGAYYYTSSIPQGDITKVDTKTDQVVHVFPKLAGGPDFTVSRDGKTIFVLKRDGNAESQTFLAVDSETGATLGSTSWVTGPFDMARNGFPISIMSEDGTFVYSTGNPVRFIDVRDRTVPRLAASIPVGGPPLLPALTPDGKQLWILGGGDGKIYVIDTIAQKVVHVIHTGRFMMHACFSADGKTAYVAQTPAKLGPPKPRWVPGIALIQVTLSTLFGSMNGVYNTRPLLDTPGEIAAYDAATYSPLPVKPVPTVAIAGPLACMRGSQP